MTKTKVSILIAGGASGMTTTVPCETLRANALRDALTDALRTGCESVISYAVLLMERDLQKPTPSGETAGKQEAIVVPAQVQKLASAPLPGSPESIEQARAYILARCNQGDCIDCRIISRLTGWDAPRIRRFVTDTQDALHASQGTRGRGRPRKGQ
jgi:hypothetical protein